MFDIERHKTYDKLIDRLADSERNLISAQGAAWSIEICDFNDRFIALENAIAELRREIRKEFQESIKEEA